MSPIRNRNVTLQNSDTFKVLNQTIYNFKPKYLYVTYMYLGMAEPADKP